LKLQTELLEKRMARLKVEVEAADLEQAKREAARRLASKVNIPGFRKGKAPQNIVARYLGEGAILEEAIDDLGPKLYNQALDETGLQPYASGSLEDIQTTDSGLTLIFTVPLVPSIDLGDYRSFRQEYTVPEVTDDMVDKAIQMMQESKAIIEPKHGPAALGDRVTMAIHGVILPVADDKASSETTQAPEGDTAAQDDGNAVLFDEEKWTFILGDKDEEPIPGFSEAVIGIAPGEQRTFDLTIPGDPESGYEEYLLGRTVHFDVTCSEVSSRHMPALNDAFAQQISNGQVETLLQLRINTRENLAKTLQQRAEQDYAAKVLDSLVEQARLDYPDVMVEEYVDHMVQNLEQNLRQRGLTLKDFLKINKLDEATLRQQYRPQAEQRLKRSLVLGEIVGLENLSVTDTEIDAEIKQRSAIFAEGNEQMQQALEEYLGAELPRRNITLDMITDLAYRRLIAIAKGEALPEATAASEIEATAAALPNEAEPGQAADHTAA